MQDFYPKFRATFSGPRLQAYHDADHRPLNLDVAARYAHNIAASMRMYPSLHIFEIALRNNLHGAFNTEFGGPNWFDQPGRLMPTQQRQLAQAKAALLGEGKAATPDQVVAELTLGFWVGLFSNAYEYPLWRAHPNLLRAVFPHAPRHMRHRASMSNVLNPIRDLRNRVAHWERITHLPALQTLKLDIDRVVRWLCPAALTFLAKCDAFDGALSSNAAADAKRNAGACFEFEEIRSL